MGWGGGTWGKAMSEPAGQSESSGSIDHALLTYNRLIGSRLYLHTEVRYVVAVVIVLGALFARYVIGITELRVGALVAVAVVVAAYNTVAIIIIRPYRDASLAGRAYKYLSRVMYAAMAMDYLALTVAIWLVGGARSPFLAFYLFHVVIGCILLSRRAAIASTAMACGLLYLLVLGEWLGIIPDHEPIGAIAAGGDLDTRYVLTVLVVYLMLFGLTAFLLIGLSEALREGERQIQRANEELDRLSNLRRDFLNIALHNLQSPVGAVTMFMNNLKSGLSGPLNEQQRDWVNRALKRLEGLTEFQRGLQMLATLDSARLANEAGDVDLSAIVRDLVEENQDLAQAHGHALEADLPDEPVIVKGVDRLLREAVVNYITNSIKYTPDGGRIVVRAARHKDAVHIEVSDNGIGISEENQKKLFQEFVRIKRDKTAKVKGTGLGLSIVRRIAETHHGRVYVRSKLNEGTTFGIELPVRWE